MANFVRLVGKFSYYGLIALLLCSPQVIAQEVLIREIPVSKNNHSDPVEEGRQFWVQLAEDIVSGKADILIPKELLDGRNLSDIKWGISPYPIMLHHVLPVSWDAIMDTPLLNVLHVFPDYQSVREIKTIDLLRVFNVEVIVPAHYRFNYPEHAVLELVITTDSRAIAVDVPMQLDVVSNAYVIMNVEELAFKLESEIEFFRSGTPQHQYVKPELTLSALSGFEFNENTVTRFRFTGIPVSYNIKIGSFVVSHGFQWAGKPDSLPLRYPQRPFLTE